NVSGTAYGTEQSFTTSACPVAQTAIYSGMGGGGTASAAELASILAPSAATTAYLESIGASVNASAGTHINCPTGSICPPPPSTTGSTLNPFNGGVVGSNPHPSQFTANLQIGSTGPEVKLLQEDLNSKGFTVASTGPGSPGNETDMFGSLTKAALAKFQKANGISPAAGYFGPITRAYVGR